jgi:methyl-accepting chemotaxis protein
LKETLENESATSLRVASDAISDIGSVRYDAASLVEWNATHQLTQERTVVKLPRVMIGQDWLRQFATDKPAPLADHVRELLGGTCSIFQRMNESRT